jgi:ribulose-5-phosphate 4-epimerase/fuculose-1-phosphate aldolase
VARRITTEAGVRGRLKEDVAFAARVLGLEGVTRGTAGHVSVRLNTEAGEPAQMLVKARGPAEEGLEFTTVRDVVRVSLSGDVLEAPDGLTAPAELWLHTEALLARPDAGAVIHVHPPWVVALSAAGRDLLPVVGGYDPTALRLIEQGIPVYDSSLTVQTAEEGKRVAACLGDSMACVLRQHGVLVVGKDLDQALKYTFALNELARLNWLAAAVGTPVPVSDADIAGFRRRAQSRTGAKDKIRADDGRSAYWHYLERRVAAHDQ